MSVKKSTAPGLLLAHEWDGEMDPTGWWMSEKLDGVRAYWNGKHLISRLGNRFYAPKWFTQGWPSIPMDGELWIGRGLFNQTVSCVKKLTPVDEEWMKIRYLVFDLPSLGKRFEQRVVEIRKVIRASLRENIAGVSQVECTGIDMMQRHLGIVLRHKGEGLMLREPGSLYVPKRSKTLLKVKQWQTADGIVIGHEPGKGKHKGRLGALVVSLRPIGRECVGLTAGHKLLKIMERDDTTVNVGTGFTDYEREHPPRKGSVITYKFQELTQDGIPRFPSYVGVRTVS
jgi:DNA ligase-1